MLGAAGEYISTIVKLTYSGKMFSSHALGGGCLKRKIKIATSMRLASSKTKLLEEANRTGRLPKELGPHHTGANQYHAGN